MGLIAKIARRLLPGLVCGLAVAAVAAAASGCIFEPSSEAISVMGVDGNHVYFSYVVNNTGHWSNGFVFEFRTSVSKTDLFDGLRRNYEVFAEGDDFIQLECDRQIYTVRRYADGHYDLYGEMFGFEGRDHLNVRFPFPTDKMPGGDRDPPQPRLPGAEFTTTADLPYLLRFYDVYGDAVKVEGNKITYEDRTITLEPGGLVRVTISPSTTTTAVAQPLWEVKLNEVATVMPRKY